MARARIPGASRGLSPRRNVWGEEVTRSPGAFPGTVGRLVSPVRASKVKPDKSAAELLRLKLTVTRPSRKFRGVELTAAQYDDLQQMRGRTMKKMLDAFTAVPGYDRLPDALKREALRRLVGKVQGVAEDVMLQKYPDLARLSAGEKAAAFTGARPRRAVKQGGALMDAGVR